MMLSDQLDGTKFKCVCADFPNIVLLTKSATPGNIQVTFGHVSAKNKYFRETTTTFALAVSLE